MQHGNMNVQSAYYSVTQYNLVKTYRDSKRGTWNYFIYHL